MRRSSALFSIVISAIVLLTACYSRTQIDKDKQTAGEKTEKVIEKIGINVPYEQVHYTKISKEFVWEFSANDKELPEGIQEDYKKYYNIAPGGFIVKETEKDYFICISIGKRQTEKDGFKLQSIELVNYDIEKEAVLKVEINQFDNETTTNGIYTGEVSVIALVRISKESLPQGIKINGITMSCN